MDRVPPGSYRRAAIDLTREDGEFDSYDLARRVRQTLGHDTPSKPHEDPRGPSSRSAARWIRAENGWVKTATGWRGGILKRTGVAFSGPGGQPATYAVIAATLTLREMD